MNTSFTRNVEQRLPSHPASPCRLSLPFTATVNELCDRDETHGQAGAAGGHRTGIVTTSGCCEDWTVGLGAVLSEQRKAQAVDAAGDSDLSPCLSRWVDRSRRIAGNDRTNLHRGLVPEAPVEAQGVRRDELHEALLPHAVVVIIGN